MVQPWFLCIQQHAHNTGEVPHAAWGIAIIRDRSADRPMPFHGYSLRRQARNNFGGEPSNFGWHV
jgi:hypothetical protein